MPSKPLSPEALAAIADTTPLKPPLSFYPSTRIRSTNFAVRGGKLLTDRQILRYAREGKYGQEIQERALAKKSPKERKKVTDGLLARALRELLKAKVVILLFFFVSCSSYDFVDHSAYSRWHGKSLDLYDKDGYIGSVTYP